MSKSDNGEPTVRISGFDQRTTEIVRGEVVETLEAIGIRTDVIQADEEADDE